MSLRNYINNKRRYNEYLLINLFLATLDLRDVFFSFLFLNGGRKLITRAINSTRTSNHTKF